MASIHESTLHGHYSFVNRRTEYIGKTWADVAISFPPGLRATSGMQGTTYIPGTRYLGTRYQTCYRTRHYRYTASTGSPYDTWYLVFSAVQVLVPGTWYIPVCTRAGSQQNTRIYVYLTTTQFCRGMKGAQNPTPPTRPKLANNDIHVETSKPQSALPVIENLSEFWQIY